MQKKQAPTTTAIGAFRRYAEAFQTLDPSAIALHFYEPALMLTPDEVVALPNGAAVEQMYKRVMADLPARGYARTEFSGLAERRLSQDVSIVTGVGVWRKASGEELQRFGLTYTLRRAGPRWRIVVGAIHEPDENIGRARHARTDQGQDADRHGRG